MILWTHFSGGNYYGVADIAGRRDGTDDAGFLQFSTTPTGEKNPIGRMRITSTGNVGIGTTSPEARLHVIDDLLGAAKDDSGNALRICCGKTPEGATNWQPYDGTNGIFVDVDTSHCGFKSTPFYLVNMHGDNRNWSTTGGGSAYSRTEKGFRIYVRYSDGGPLTPADANSWKWHIQWIAIGK